MGHEQGFGDEAHSAYLPTHYLPADRGRTCACAAARAASASRLAVNSSETEPLAEARAGASTCGTTLSWGCERRPSHQSAERHP